MEPLDSCRNMLSHKGVNIISLHLVHDALNLCEGKYFTFLPKELNQRENKNENIIQSTTGRQIFHKVLVSSVHLINLI